MKDVTTVKIDKDTFNLLIRYKALVERITGKSLTFNGAIKISIAISDWIISVMYNLTNKDIEDYIKELLEKIKSKDESIDIISLLEEADAYSFDIVKRK